MEKYSVEKSRKRVRVMFQDEAGFGRISNPKRCWAPKGIRPVTPRHHIREYRYAYGCTEPATGEHFYLILPYANTACMNIYLEHLAAAYPNDMLLVALDRASWHTTDKLVIPENIELFFLPPATPEMNLQEPQWKMIRARGFKNEAFASLSKVVDRLCETIVSLTNDEAKSASGGKWLLPAL
jgi:putative transposase